MRRKPFLTLLQTLCLALLGFMLTGCGGSNSPTGGSLSAAAGPVPVGTGTVVQPNVTVLPSDGSVTVAAQDANSVTLTGALPALPVGQIIVSGAGQGLLRKVVSSSSSGGTTVVQTQQATLEDVFQQSSIVMNKTLGASDFSTMTPALPGVTFSPVTAQARPRPHDSSVEIDVHLAHVTLPKDAPDSGASVELNGDISLKVGLDIDIETDLGGLKYAKFVPTINDTLNVSLTGKATYTFAKVKTLIGHLEGDPIDIQVGPVPVVFVPELDIYTTVDGSVEAGLSLSSTVSLGLSAGVEYQRGSGWHTVTSVSRSVQLSPIPNLYASVQASWTPVRPELSLLLYGVVGPYASAESPTLGVQLTRQTNPAGLQVTADATFTGSTGVKVTVLGKDVADQDYPDAIDEKINLIDNFYPDNGIVNAGIN